MRDRERVSGQALVEYVLLMFFIVGFTTILANFMPRVLQKMEAPLKDGFVRAYKYGDPKACGPDPGDPPSCGGSPARHPRINNPKGVNFRLFGRGP
jgi:hypothetical protein